MDWVNEGNTWWIISGFDFAICTYSCKWSSLPSKGSLQNISHCKIYSGLPPRWDVPSQGNGLYSTAMSLMLSIGITQYICQASGNDPCYLFPVESASNILIYSCLPSRSGERDFGILTTIYLVENNWLFKGVCVCVCVCCTQFWYILNRHQIVLLHLLFIRIKTVGPRYNLWESNFHP